MKLPRSCHLQIPDILDVCTAVGLATVSMQMRCVSFSRSHSKVTRCAKVLKGTHRIGCAGVLPLLPLLTTN